MRAWCSCSLAKKSGVSPFLSGGDGVTARPWSLTTSAWPLRAAQHRAVEPSRSAALMGVSPCRKRQRTIATKPLVAAAIKGVRPGGR